MKKLIALVLAAVMMMTVVSAFAATEAEPREFTNPTGAFKGEGESSIQVAGLEAADGAQYYQLLSWQGTTIGTSETGASGGWKFVSPMPGSTGLTVDDLLDGISAAEAALIANVYEGIDGTAMTGTGTVSADVPLGLYYIKAIATSDDTIYNPIFVAADHYTGNNSIDVSEMNIGSSSVAKKSKVEFDKQTGHGETEDFTYRDVAPGDFIPFKITTTIPPYGAAYDDATFEITDTFSDGLVLAIDEDHAFTVKYGTGTDEGNEAGVTKVYTSTAADGASSYKITFDKDNYLLSSTRGATPVTITYYGKVTTDAPSNVNPLDNTADLKYSNKPDETTTKHDITRHYTFSIDANLLGGTGSKTSELLKVGLDKNGNVITETKVTVHNSEISPLAGANFTLTPVGGSGAKFGPNTVGTINSASDGRLEFHGLDAGIYKLVENSAPAGFVKDGKTYYVKIEPTYDETVKDLLKSYKVLWSDDGTNFRDVTTFTMTNNGLVEWSEKVDNSTDADNHAAIQNKQGAELPSTGGIGTTIFYMVGGLMVLAAGIVLVTRRKAEEE